MFSIQVANAYHLCMEQANEQAVVSELQRAHNAYIATPAAAKEKTHSFEEWLKENQELGEYRCGQF